MGVAGLPGGHGLRHGECRMHGWHGGGAAPLVHNAAQLVIGHTFGGEALVSLQVVHDPPPVKVRNSAESKQIQTVKLSKMEILPTMHNDEEGQNVKPCRHPKPNQGISMYQPDKTFHSLHAMKQSSALVLA